jgi:hypothetical protein
MKKYNSKQKNVPFIWCPDPITIDKRSSWGNTDDNLQVAPNGAFLKLMNNSNNCISIIPTISHLVQPKEDKSAPVGWVPTLFFPGLFDKEPIWVEDIIVPAGDNYEFQTADGKMVYCLDEDAKVCYNCLENGEPNYEDGWIQTVSEIEKNYEL